tara:strand:- start:5 stop:634 length:630 start_codon:yes stop_codon:yes gene_type:complete
LINNKLITFEGIDGSGKSTQIGLLNEWFNSKNIKAINIREPGGSHVSESIRTILLDKKNKIDSFSETLLFLAARSHLVEEVIVPGLNDNKFVICDRFIDSTVVYQGYGRKLGVELINQINRIAAQGILPFLTIYIDIDVQLSISRRRNNVDDRMEEGGLEFLTNVKKGYDELALLYPDRIHTINGNDSILEIQNKIRHIVEQKYKEFLC